MIAYYVHWIYPASADDANFYAGQDDDKLFHHKENAENYAKDKISEWNNNSARFYYLELKSEEYELTPEEQEEYDNLSPLVYGDLPDSYTIRKREIKFEDDTDKSKVWIARDKYGDLYIYHYKPDRYDLCFGVDYEDPGVKLNSKSHPEITWENSPQQIEI